MVTNPPDGNVEPWLASGATWCLRAPGAQAALEEVHRAIDAGSRPAVSAR